MNHFIAMNPQRGGNKGSASCLPLAEYDKLIAQPWLHDMVEQIRGGNDKLKGLMPFRCGHYSRFLKNHRSQKDADPTSFLFQTTIDIDDKELVGIAIEMARQLNCSDSIWNGMLLHLEYSARKKLHIDIRMPIGMTIEETQRAYCEALGVPCDESCFTPERILFITDQDSEIYRSKDWYAVLPADELKARREAYLKRGLTIDGRAGKVNSLQFTVNSNSNDNVQNNRLSGNDGNPAVSAGSAVQPAQPGNSHGADAPHIGDSGGNQDAGGLGAREKNLIAFDLFTQAAGLGGMEIDTVGSRHSSLLAIMSAGASRVMEEEELMKVVRLKMPSYYQENDCHQLIHDFYAKYADNTKPMSREVMRVNALAEQKANEVKSEERRVKNSMAAANHTVQSSNLQVQSTEQDYPDPPEMPKIEDSGDL